MGFKKNNKMTLTHGHRKDSKWSGAYNSWRGMKGRCDNVRNCRWKYYGALGISYDPEWADFHHFLLDMGYRPKNAELHRKDKKKDYSKDNCEWLDKYVHHKLHQKERDYLKDFSNRV